MIALVARRDGVALGGFPAAGQGHHVVHGQLVRLKQVAAVVAAAFVELLFPPGRAFEGAGFVPLLANPFGGFGIRVDFEVGFEGHDFYLPLTPPYKGGEAELTIE